MTHPMGITEEIPTLMRVHPHDVAIEKQMIGITIGNSKVTLKALSSFVQL